MEPAFYQTEFIIIKLYMEKVLTIFSYQTNSYQICHGSGENTAVKFIDKLGTEMTKDKMPLTHQQAGHSLDP